MSSNLHPPDISSVTIHAYANVNGVCLCRPKERDSGRDAEQQSGGSSRGTADRLALRTSGSLRFSLLAATVILMPELDHDFVDCLRHLLPYKALTNTGAILQRSYQVGLLE